MQELPNLHRNYSYRAIIWGSVHPTEENILLLGNINMYNYTAVPQYCMNNHQTSPCRIACCGQYPDTIERLGEFCIKYPNTIGMLGEHCGKYPKMVKSGSVSAVGQYPNKMYSPCVSTGLFTRLEESSLVPAGFLTAEFLQKRYLWSLCFDWRTKMEFLFIASIEKKKSEEKSICHPSSFSIHPLSLRKAVKEAPANFLQAS